MCGIAGFIDHTLSPDDARRIGEAMLAITSHRGPDHQGMHGDAPAWLGHNRLSIIDLSPASHQPFHYRGRWMTFNGEVYNYLELRQELERDGYTFTTSGDTEVILAAYDRWGHRCVDHFIGMWALAIWDPEKQELFCSRDRFGIKPFVYVHNGPRLYFCSEAKGLRPTPLFHSDINHAQIARGLYLGWMQHHDESYFSCVKNLPAAHNMLWKDGTITIWQYYDIDTHTVDHGSFEEHAEEFREVFLDSIRLTSRRDVPLGVCLSGGLDSTSIACALAGEEASVRSFTAYYTGRGEVDERPYIDHVLRAYPSITPEYISPTDGDVALAVERIAWLMDAPLPSSSYISQYFVMKLAAQHGIKVTLDGQGSDEIMGGYMHSMYRVIADDIRSFRGGAMLRDLGGHLSRQRYGISKSASIIAKSLLTTMRDEPSLYNLELTHSAPWVLTQQASAVSLGVEMHAGTRLNSFLHNLIYVTLLPTLLHTEDINSMAFSIESRVPFLDHRLVQLCFSMPNDHKIGGGETKRVLRSAMRGLVPDQVLDRKDKTGFITPGHITWLRGALSSTLEGTWSELDGIVDHRHLHAVLDKYRAGDNTNALFVWRLAMLRLFMRAHTGATAA